MLSVTLEGSYVRIHVRMDIFKRKFNESIGVSCIQALIVLCPLGDNAEFRVLIPIYLPRQALCLAASYEFEKFDPFDPFDLIFV